MKPARSGVGDRRGLEWPRTSALLHKIAAQYEAAQAKYHDDHADRYQW